MTSVEALSMGRDSNHFNTHLMDLLSIRFCTSFPRWNKSNHRRELTGVVCEASIKSTVRKIPDLSSLLFSCQELLVQFHYCFEKVNGFGSTISINFYASTISPPDECKSFPFKFHQFPASSSYRQ